MKVVSVGRAVRRRSSGVACAFFALAATLLTTSATQTAVANGDTRTLHLYHTHTGESIDATFRVNGHYDPAVLRQLNHFLRDWRNNDEINMDPRLFDTLWEVYRTAGATQPIQIYSAYRSPETNAMLRRRSRAVAEHSQHMLGKAMDTTIPGFPMHLIREVGMKLQHGGVGWYPSANFVHLDVGGVRSWPRMSYDQLSQLFPDGKTVHVASNGQVLPGYEAARAEIAARGDIEVPPAQESQGFFAWLFSGFGGSAGEDEEDRRAVAQAAPAPAPAAAAAPAPAQKFAEAAVAYAGPETDVATQATPAAVRPSEATEPTEAAIQPATTTKAAPVSDPAVADVPVPPRRPLELAMLEDVPLPPTRPQFAARAQTSAATGTSHGKDRIGTLIATSNAGISSLHRVQLPAIITQGDHNRLPREALAFAEAVATPPQALRSAPMPVARSLSPRQVALRAAYRDRYMKVNTTESREMPDDGDRAPHLASGPQLTGLRRAAHLMAQKASL